MPEPYVLHNAHSREKLVNQKLTYIWSKENTHLRPSSHSVLPRWRVLSSTSQVYSPEAQTYQRLRPNHRTRHCFLSPHTQHYITATHLSAQYILFTVQRKLQGLLKGKKAQSEDTEHLSEPELDREEMLESSHWGVFKSMIKMLRALIGKVENMQEK